PTVLFSTSLLPLISLSLFLSPSLSCVIASPGLPMSGDLCMACAYLPFRRRVHVQTLGPVCVCVCVCVCVFLCVCVCDVFVCLCVWVWAGVLSMAGVCVCVSVCVHVQTLGPVCVCVLLR